MPRYFSLPENGWRGQTIKKMAASVQQLINFYLTQESGEGRSFMTPVLYKVKTIVPVIITNEKTKHVAPPDR